MSNIAEVCVLVSPPQVTMWFEALSAFISLQVQPTKHFLSFCDSASAEAILQITPPRSAEQDSAH